MFCSKQAGKFSSNPVKVQSEGLVDLLIYTRDKQHLGLRYYTNIEDVPLYDLLWQAIINTENQLMVFYDSIWQECPDNLRSKLYYIVFYQGGPIDNFTHVPDPVY